MAYVAGGVRSAVVLVQEAAAGSKIKKRQAEYRSAEAPQTRESRIFVEPQHTIQLTPLTATLDAQSSPPVVLFITVGRFELLTRPGFFLILVAVALCAGIASQSAC